jgi:hypothetical protein
LRPGSFIGTWLLSASTLGLVGCGMLAPPYSPSIEHVEKLKRVGGSAAIGPATATPGLSATIGIRASSMSSPVGNGFAAYLADALTQELRLAGKLDPKSSVEISVVLIKNDISAAGFSTNSGEIEARFVVKRGGTPRYDKVKRAETSWDSHFMGAIAIPKAQQEYPGLVQKLLTVLLDDADFVATLN